MFFGGEEYISIFNDLESGSSLERSSRRDKRRCFLGRWENGEKGFLYLYFFDVFSFFVIYFGFGGF